MDRPQSAFFFCCLCFTLVNFRFSLAAVDEQQILLAFKQQLVDSSNVLDNWNDSTPLCRWKGVSCDSSSKSVTGIDFSNFHLNGTISSIICELPNLTSLIFLWNNFRQSFPFWVAKCHKLSHLDLGQNFFSGPLPSNISISSLRHLDLSYNEFTGPVPADFGELSTLERLDLAGNRITTLAPELGKLSNLTYLSLMSNIHLIPAPIPPQFGKLSKITYLNLAYCQLIGEIPPELGDLKELDYLQLQSNNLTGSIPVELMFLPKLTKLELYINQLSGEIPQEVGNLVSLTDLDASQNFISGSIPERISELKNLRILHLENLVLFKNKLTGEIPRLLGINTTLCNGEALENVSLYANSFTGRIPESYGRCRSLLRFQLQDNSFEGPIPASLWASPKLTLLDISFNKFNGSVPSTIGGASRLNNLFLVEFTASSNRFSDSYPFGSCTSLANLNMSRNQLSGVISADVGNCLELNTLDLSANKLSGSIPSALGSLPRINALDLSDNQLSGFIPSSLGKPLLSMLNVSNNNLQGSLPGNWKNDFPSESFQGNPRLCVDRCPSATSSKDRDHLPVGLIVAIVIIGTVMLVIVGALSFCWRQHKLMHTPRWKVQSFQRLSFDEMTVVEKMEENNVVGCGRSSKVYRVDRKR